MPPVVSDNFRLYFRQHNIRGRIFLYDLKLPDKEVKELKVVRSDTFDQSTFSPHGISVWEDNTSGTRHPHPEGSEVGRRKRIAEVKSITCLSLSLSLCQGKAVVKRMHLLCSLFVSLGPSLSPGFQ